MNAELIRQLAAAAADDSLAAAARADAEATAAQERGDDAVAWERRVFAAQRRIAAGAIADAAQRLAVGAR
jgi:hypothetical protein